jgi:hypothetical protein
MIHVFICMPYGDHNTLQTRERHVDAAIEVYHQLLDYYLFIPYCPHLSHFVNEVQQRPRSEWLNVAKIWLKRCDCLLIGSKVVSEGMQDEIDMAHRLNKPVFRSIREMGVVYGLTDSHDDSETIKYDRVKEAKV